MQIDFDDKQGGKKWGAIRSQQEQDLDEINKDLFDDEALQDLEDLAEKLESYKKKFMEFDLDGSGDIDMYELKIMLEKLGQPKTHLELKKMLKEVDKTNTGTISYREFIDMMLGTKNSVLKMILIFEERAKEKENKQTGPPPKKNIADLP